MIPLLRHQEFKRLLGKIYPQQNEHEFPGIIITFQKKRPYAMIIPNGM
jgi:hypothetical protein